jgi:multidrug efflux pump subunit AcrA (membrane-fusion protein)
VAPNAWLVFGAAVAVLLAGLAWGLLGQVDREVVSAGIITRDPYMSSVESHRAGVLTSQDLALGTEVNAGEVIARVTDSTGDVLQVRAPVAGRIESWYVSRLNTVAAGERIALVEPRAPLVAYLFVSAADGKRITKGMPVRLSPGGTSPQDDGLLEGRVKRVLPYPVDAQRVQLLTAQPHLVDEFLQGQARIEVDVALVRDSRTRSGFSWTNGTGPAHQITGGTVSSGSVIIGTGRPLSLLLGDGP